MMLPLQLLGTREAMARLVLSRHLQRRALLQWVAYTEVAFEMRSRYNAPKYTTAPVSVLT